MAHPDAPPLAPLLTTRPRPRTGARAEVRKDMADGADPQRLTKNTHRSYMYSIIIFDYHHVACHILLIMTYQLMFITMVNCITFLMHGTSEENT